MYKRQDKEREREREREREGNYEKNQLFTVPLGTNIFIKKAFKVEIYLALYRYILHYIENISTKLSVFWKFMYLLGINNNNNK